MPQQQLQLPQQPSPALVPRRRGWRAQAHHDVARLESLARPLGLDDEGHRPLLAAAGGRRRSPEWLAQVTVRTGQAQTKLA